MSWIYNPFTDDFDYYESGSGGNLVLGETEVTAYRGDRGKTAYDHSQLTNEAHGCVLKPDSKTVNMVEDTWLPVEHNLKREACFVVARLADGTPMGEPDWKPDPDNLTTKILVNSPETIADPVTLKIF